MGRWTGGDLGKRWVGGPGWPGYVAKQNTQPVFDSIGFPRQGASPNHAQGTTRCGRAGSRSTHLRSRHDHQGGTARGAPLRLRPPRGQGHPRARRLLHRASPSPPGAPAKATRARVSLPVLRGTHGQTAALAVASLEDRALAIPKGIVRLTRPQVLKNRYARRLLPGCPPAFAWTPGKRGKKRTSVRYRPAEVMGLQAKIPR